MSLLLALALAQTPAFPSSFTARQGISRDGGVAWVFECSNCTGSSASPSAVNVLDAGVLNINLPSFPDGGSLATDATAQQIAAEFLNGVRVTNLPPAPLRNPLTGAAKVDGSGAIQPISAQMLPLPVGAAQEDGGNLAAILAQEQALMAIEVQGWIRPPLNPFLLRCNPVRRTNCQP